MAVLKPADRSGTVGAPAPAVRVGIVSRGVLVQRLTDASRVALVSAPAGSGKTLLLRSWIGAAGLAGRAAWVPVQGEERDPQRFWICVTDALRATDAGSKLVRPLAAAPDLDGWAVVERLLKDLSALDDRLWLVIDDVHELCSGEALRQLELLVLRAPPELRFVLATRHDLRLGLHRLRLEGELTEISTVDLRFSLDEARALLEAAGVELSEPALALLHARTEGWAAGLRLAALSLAGHPDPERFGAEFSGSERTVAEYLLAEVLDRQSEEVRRLLLRTSVLERVNGELADLLSGKSRGEGNLQDLEQAGAFVVSLDAQRSWFRYHQLFADLLRLELRRSAPDELPALHAAAAGWFAEHGYAVEAVRHAQSAEDWGAAARLLSDHSFGLYLEGRGASAHDLLAGFPADVVAADAELTIVLAADELTMGWLEAAERNLARATEGMTPVPADRRGRFQVALAIMRLALAQVRGDLPAATEEAQRLLAPADVADAAQLGLGQDLRALALVSLGTAELWTLRADDAEQHLEQGAALTRQIGRPWLEVDAVAHGAWAATFRSFAVAVERSTQAIELARRHGWAGEPIVAVAYATLGAIRLWQVRLEEAEELLDRAVRALRAEAEPAAGLVLYQARGMLELARGRDTEALAAFQAAERLAGLLGTAHPRTTPMWAPMVHTLVRLGETGCAEAAIAALDEEQRKRGEVRIAVAALRLTQDDPQAASAVLAPVLAGSVPVTNRGWLTHAFVLAAIAYDALGDLAAAGHTLEHALDLAEPDGLVFAFLLAPAPGLLERHARQHTAHAALLAEILSLLAGKQTAAPVGREGGWGGGPGLTGPLTYSEVRVLRYLPTNLSAPEIAGQLSVSVNTVRTHLHHIYDKLGAHRRREAVERARALGLLAPHLARPA
jgi:LuxR family transcriptional regulator, maltose regulon positive regulatory protein